MNVNDENSIKKATFRNGLAACGSKRGTFLKRRFYVDRMYGWLTGSLRMPSFVESASDKLRHFCYPPVDDENH